MGAYCDVEWQVTGAPKFACGVDTRLFTLRTTTMPNSPSLTQNTEQEPSSIHVYPWTGGENRYGILCDRSRQRIAFGGGGNGEPFALCIDSNFTRGTTAACTTFGNPPLMGNETEENEKVFDIVDLEVYALRMV